MGIILRYRDFLKTYKTRGHRIRHLENYKNLFPIKSSSVLAGVIADLICDGNLQGDPKWRMDFTSKSIKELKRFEGEMNSLFNVKGKIRRCSTNKFGKTYNLAINCSPITRILFLCGVPAGQKVLTSFGIPKWIKKDKKCFRRFAQRVFSCEGGIMYEEKRKIPQIRLGMWKADYLIEKDLFINELVENLKKYFGINSTVVKKDFQNIRKDGIITKPTKVYILGDSVLKFSKQVQFEGEKQKTLKAKLPKLK